MFKLHHFLTNLRRSILYLASGCSFVSATHDNPVSAHNNTAFNDTVTQNPDVHGSKSTDELGQETEDRTSMWVNGAPQPMLNPATGSKDTFNPVPHISSGPDTLGSLEPDPLPVLFMADVNPEPTVNTEENATTLR